MKLHSIMVGNQSRVKGFFRVLRSCHHSKPMLLRGTLMKGVFLPLNTP